MTVSKLAKLSFLTVAFGLSLPFVAHAASESKACVSDQKKVICAGDKISVTERSGNITPVKVESLFVAESALKIEVKETVGESYYVDPEEVGLKNCKWWSKADGLSKIFCAEHWEAIPQIDRNSCIKAPRGKICAGDTVWQDGGTDAGTADLAFDVFKISTLDGKKILVSGRGTMLDPKGLGLTKGCVKNVANKSFCVGDGVFFKQGYTDKQPAVIGAIYPDGSFRITYWNDPGSASRTEKATMLIPSADYVSPRDSAKLPFPYIY
jgi:ribosomal protein L23